MNLLNNSQSYGIETVFDHAINDEERIRLGVPTHEAYFEILEGDRTSVNAHLCSLRSHLRQLRSSRQQHQTPSYLQTQLSS